MKKFTLTFATLFVAIFSYSQCDYTLEMIDSYGDGWGTGNSIDIYVGGELVLDGVTLPYGESIERTFSVSTGAGITATYNCGGSYCYEAGYKIFDNTGAQVASVSGSYPDGPSDIADGELTATCVSCLPVSLVAPSNITTSSAVFSWTLGGSETNLNIEYGPEDFIQGDGSVATITATTDTYTLSLLTPNTSYDFYIQSDCGAGDTSSWVGPVTFTTEPDPIVPDYTNNFISYPGENWSEGTGETTPSGTSSEWTGDAFGNVGTNGSARINIYGTGGDEWLITPTFDLSSGGYEINLDVALTDYDNTDADVIGDDDAVYLMQSPDNGVSWTQIHKWDFDNSPSNSGDNKTFDISELTSATTKFALYMFEGSSPNGDVNFYVDNFAVRTPPSCFSPQSNSLSVANVSSSSVDILWAQGGTETDYQYVVQDAGTGQPTGVGMTVTGATTVTDTTLTAVTDYEIYVRSNCGTNGFSAWVGPLQFTTLCADVTEFSENFDSVTTPQLPVCWSELISSGVSSSASVETSTSADASAPNGVRLYNSFSTTGDVILVSPSVSNLAANTHRLKLKAKNTSSEQDIQIGTLSDPSDSSTFTLLETVDINTTFTEYVIDFSSYSGTYTYIGFRRLMSSSYTSVYLDDIVWEEIPSTPPSCASNFSETLDTSCGNNDFSISWDPATNSDGYYISVGTTPGGTDIEASTDLGNDTTYDFTSVTVATTYYYTVVPYNASGSASECAEQNLTTVETGCYCISTPSSNDGDGISNVFFGDSEFTSAGDSVRYEDFTATAVSISQSTSAKLDITFATGFTYDTHVWVDFNDDYNFSSDELMFSGESTSADPVTLDASFLVPSDAPLGDHRVRIGTADSGQVTPNPCYDSTYGVTIDMTITVTDPPSCVQPSALTVADVTDNSVILSWTAGDTETDYQYVVQFAGTGEPTGVGMTVTGATTVTDTTLTAATDYEVYVRSNCGTNGFSAWTGALQFTTLCADVTEFSENFDSVTTPQLPDCWSGLISSGVSQYAYVETSTSADASAPNGVKLYNYSSTTGDIILVSPRVSNLAANTHRLKLKAKNTSEEQDIQIGTLSDPSDSSTFTLLETVDINTTFTEYVIDFSSYSGTDTYIGFRRLMSSTYTSVYLDDIVWEEIPSCIKVSSLTTSNITTTSADLSWIAGGTEAAWNIEYGVPDFTLGAGTTVAVTANSYTLSGLTANTSYDIYVQADCGSGDTSLWVGPITIFTGYCVPSSSSSSTYIDSVTSTGEFSDLNNGDNGYSDSGYGDYFSTYAIQSLAGESFDLTATIVGGTAGFAVWIDYNNDLTFDSTEVVYNTTGYSNGPFTATIALPETLADGDYRMRLIVDWNDSNPDDACLAGTRAEAEDYKITIDSSLGMDTLSTSNFTYFPNPVNNVLSIKAQASIDSITVYNMLGQTVVRSTPNTTTTAVDMSELQTGAYFVQVAINNSIETVRVLKN